MSKAWSCTGPGWPGPAQGWQYARYGRWALTALAALAPAASCTSVGSLSLSPGERDKCQHCSHRGEERAGRSVAMNTEERCEQCGCAKVISLQNVTLEEQIDNPEECKTVEKVGKVSHVVANVEEDDSLTVVVKRQEAALKRLEEKHGSGIFRESSSDG